MPIIKKKKKKFKIYLHLEQELVYYTTWLCVYDSSESLRTAAGLGASST